MRKIWKNMDKPLFFTTIILCIIGLVMVFSASSISAVLRYKVDTYYFFNKQLIVMIVGFLGGILLILNIPTRKYRYLSGLMMLGIMAALAGLFFYSKLTNGVYSWYNLGLFSFQPSEFAKSIVIVYMASFFGKHIGSKQKWFFAIPILACMLVAALIFLQPDLGTTAILSLTVFFMFIAIPFDKKNKEIKIIKILGLLGIAAVACLMVFGGELLNEEQASRLTYKEPCSRYMEKTGYQVCNGMIAMNNGGLFGVGLGNSTQKYLYLPEAHTDFIFPIIVEELGSIPSALIILLYLFMLFRILKISKNARDLTGSLIAYGTFLVILLHLIVNFGGILALIPLTGVPVPLLSYGGSITLNTLIMIFLTLRVSVESNLAKVEKAKTKAS